MTIMNISVDQLGSINSEINNKLFDSNNNINIMIGIEISFNTYDCFRKNS